MTTLLRFTADLRSYARRTGLTRLVNTFRRSIATGYEDNFGRSLLAAIRPGDCVWDVGANIGFYTGQFARAVGPSGFVYAFEPAPAAAAALREHCDTNTAVMEIALADRDGILPMAVEDDPLATTHSLAVKAGGKTVDVHVATGDSLVAAGSTRPPNVIKIDVEGFEPEVLAGLQMTLQSPACRAVFLEVHFGILDRRGQRYAPQTMKEGLEDAGYVTQWLDASHLSAVRDRD